MKSKQSIKNAYAGNEKRRTALVLALVLLFSLLPARVLAQSEPEGEKEQGDAPYIYVGTRAATATSTNYQSPVYYSGAHFYNDVTCTAGTHIVDGSGNAIATIDAMLDVLTAGTSGYEIILIDVYEVTAAENWNPSNPVTIRRGHTNRMIKVSAALTLGEKVTMNGYHVDSAQTGIEVTGNGIMTINGATITDFTVSSSGAALFINGGSVEMNSGTINANNAGAAGGAIYIGSGTFTMNGGIIKSNTAVTQGGGIRAIVGATINIQGGTIVGNTAADGADISSAGVTNISGGSVGVANGTQVTNTSGTNIRLYTVSVGHSNAYVKSISVTGSDNNAYSYGSNMQTDASGKLYVWLPEGSTVGSVTLSDDSVVTITAPAPEAYINTSSIAAGATLTVSLLNETPTKCEWYRKDTASGEGALIANASGYQYATTAVDIGRYIFARVYYNGDTESVDSRNVSIAANSISYTVTIPSAVNFQSAGGSFSITGVLYRFLPSQHIDVAVSSLNGWKLKLDTQELNYTLSHSNTHSPALSNGDIAATFASTGSSVTVYYNITGSPIYAGSYTDQLTFTVTYDNGSAQ